MRLFDLNMVELGDLMIRLPMMAQALGHTSLEQTDTYMHPGCVEAEYAVDVLYGLAQGKMSITEFAEKWCGSEEEMMAAFQRRIERGESRTDHKLTTPTPV